MRQVQQVSRSSPATLPISLSFCTLVYLPPCYCTHLLPFQMVMALNHAGALQLEVNSLLRREFMDCHAVFLRFGPAGTENFSLWPNHFGHSSLPQYTTGLWLLLSCIMEQNPVSVPSLYTSPPLIAPQKPPMICGGTPTRFCAPDDLSKLLQSELMKFAS